jgi:hypothetical protein
MPIISWAPTARYHWSADIGRHVAIDVQGTTATGRPVNGTLKAKDLATLRARLIARGVPRAEAVRITLNRT